MIARFAGLIAAVLMMTSAPLASAPAATPGAGPDIAAQRAAMARLDWMAGAWEGTGWTLSPDGTRWAFRQTEKVESRLNGAVLVIEGRGFAPRTPQGPTEPTQAPRPESLVFNALAVISFDDAKAKYAFRSYAFGYANTFEAEFSPDGAFVWRIAPPNGPLMRYVITRPSPDEWLEVGERSIDAGRTWTQFFEMRLTRTQP